MPRRLEERQSARAFWRSHFEVWELSGLTQREYCERHGLSLKNFGNWRGQLKREDAVGSRARWGRYPRLRPSSGPGSRPSSERPKIERPKTERPRIEKPAPTVVTEPGGRRRFSEDAKRRIVEETCQPGVSVSRVARQYGITTSLLFRWRQALGVAPLPKGTTFLPVQITDDGAPAIDPRAVSDAPVAPSIIVERVAAGIEIELIGGRRTAIRRPTSKMQISSDREWTPPIGTHLTGAVGAPSAGSVIWCRGMTDKPVIPRPPKIPRRRSEQLPGRQISPADLTEALKAHRRWLENGPSGGKRLDLDGCDLKDVALQGALLNRAGLNRAILTGALLSDAKLTRADLTGAELEGARLDRADLKGARMSGANLRRAYLTATHAPYMDAEFADFSGAQLDHVDFSGADLSGAIMPRANLTGARLSRANLRGADLREARMTGADLRAAKLGAADLRGADLTGANLRGAYMRLTRLDDANLAGADLTDAAWLTQTQLDRARLDETVVLPEALTILNRNNEDRGPRNGAHDDG